MRSPTGLRPLAAVKGAAGTTRVRECAGRKPRLPGSRDPAPAGILNPNPPSRSLPGVLRSHVLVGQKRAGESTPVRAESAPPDLSDAPALLGTRTPAGPLRERGHRDPPGPSARPRALRLPASVRARARLRAGSGRLLPAGGRCCQPHWGVAVRRGRGRPRPCARLFRNRCPPRTTAHCSWEPPRSRRSRDPRSACPDPGGPRAAATIPMGTELGSPPPRAPPTPSTVGLGDHAPQARVPGGRPPEPAAALARTPAPGTAPSVSPAAPHPPGAEVPPPGLSER